jgi:hypothetical protein
MTKHLLAAAAVAAIAFSGAAFAGEATKSSTAGPVAMSDAEMDRVTAGDAAFIRTNNGDVSPNWSRQGELNAGHGFRGNNDHAARCVSCGQ